MLTCTEERRTAERTADATPISQDDMRQVSVVIPIHNEEENIEPLFEEIAEVLDGAKLDYEVIFVDDGSTDESLDKLKLVATDHPRVMVIELRRNFGQTAAMAAGIDHCRGKVIIPMDGDQQNDPHDIPALLEKLDGPPSYDIVSGWRKDRQDTMVKRKIPSKIANALIRKITDVHIHDFGCTLKAYRREVLDGVGLFSEMHRFLPALARWQGAKTTEMVVNHRPRTRGVTKYGLERTMKVLLDLVTVKFLGTYMTKPLYFFGKIAMWAAAGSLIFLLISILQKFGIFTGTVEVNGEIVNEYVKLNRNVLLSLSTLMFFLGLQCVLFGVVSELIVRVYHESRGRPVYRVRRIFRDDGQ